MIPEVRRSRRLTAMYNIVRVEMTGHGRHQLTIDFLETEFALQNLNEGEIEETPCGMYGLARHRWISVEAEKRRTDERTMLPGLLMTMNSRS